ncbi:hypothetical protein ACIREK_30925 [Streptomyces sp. NPDC102415]|uniref:hypothetical protein n=1 Tax=Streptomyces sp. NPDC102415 TaxID=3366173 RepID=UPI003813DB8B
MRTTCSAILLTLTAALALSGCTDDDDGKTSSAGSKQVTRPTYKITERETVGAVRNVLVQVDTDQRLEAVYAAVKTELTDEAVYIVGIECSTGGDEYDRRLANGRYIVGAAGAAEAGLPAGTSEYQDAGGKCPA